MRAFTLSNHSHKHFVIFSVSSVDRKGNCFAILISFPWAHFVLKVHWYKANVLETGEAGEKYGRGFFCFSLFQSEQTSTGTFSGISFLPPSPHLLKICKDIFSLNLSEKEEDGYFLLINPKILNKATSWPRCQHCTTAFSHVPNQTTSKALHIACIFIFWHQLSGEERQRRKKWWAQELVMSTMATPSSLSSPGEVCCHIWISVSRVISCTLQSKPGALHSISRGNKKHDEFMTQLM